MENLESCTKLAFLALFGNRITKVEGVSGLPCLELLDVSNNLIEGSIDPSSLPPTLTCLNASGNPCSLNFDHRRMLVEAVPGLEELDEVRGER